MNSSLLAGSAGKCCECCWCPWTKEKCPQGSRVTLNSDGRPHKSQAPSVQRRQISHLEETPEGTCEDPRLFKSWVRKPGLQWRKATHLPAWAFSPLGHLVITPTILSPQGPTASTRMKSRGLELCCCVLVLRKNSRWPKSSTLSSSKRHVKSQSQSRCPYAGGHGPGVWDGTG